MVQQLQNFLRAYYGGVCIANAVQITANSCAIVLPFRVTILVMQHMYAYAAWHNCLVQAWVNNTVIIKAV